MESTLFLVGGFVALVATASGYLQFRTAHRRAKACSDLTGWKHLGFSDNKHLRSQELRRLFQVGTGGCGVEGNTWVYSKSFETSGLFGLLHIQEKGDTQFIAMPYFLARNRNYLNLTGYLPYSASHLRGIGRLVPWRESEAEPLYAELLGYRHVQRAVSDPWVVVAVSFYPRCFHSYAVGERPDVPPFRVSNADGEQMDALRDICQPGLTPLADPEKHDVEQLPHALLTGSVIASGEQINRGSGKRIFYATVDAGSVMVDMVLDDSFVNSPLSVGSYVYSDGRVVADILY